MGSLALVAVGGRCCVAVEGRAAAPEELSCLASASRAPMMAGEPRGDFPRTLSALLREGGRWLPVGRADEEEEGVGLELK